MESSKKDDCKKSQMLTLNLYKGYKVHLCTPLIILRIALFLYYGSTAFAFVYVNLTFKQRGVTLLEISWITMCAPFVQYIGTVLSGVIADKIGTAKPVLAGNVILLMSSVFALTMLPSLQDTSACDFRKINSSCLQLNSSFYLSSCPDQSLQRNISELYLCSSLNEINDDIKRTSMKFFHENEMITNDSLFNDGSNTYYFGNLSNNYYFCTDEGSQLNNSLCNFTTLKTSNASQRSKILLAHAILFVLFLTGLTCTYRCFDVTTMFLVNEHKSSFGYERFYGFVGMTLLPIVSGFTVASQDSYIYGLYLYVLMCFLVLVVAIGLPITLNPPGSDMFQKSLQSFCNVDFAILCFVFAILGTGHNIFDSYQSWYIEEELHASKMLLSVLPAITSAYGLPFLICSRWIIKRTGTEVIFCLAFLAHSVKFIGLSFLRVAWTILLLELTTIFAYHLLWVAVVEHLYKVAPEGLRATVISTSGGIHYTMTKVLSGFLGSTVLNSSGTRLGFRYLGVASFIAVFIYIIMVAIRRQVLKSKSVPTLK